MVQVRCPECGYLQTLSEERFLSISEDFLNCPHCNARVPKLWTPVDKDTVPEEQRHKMLAFSRRILNGGEVQLEMVRALEGLVRNHGPLEDSYKAIGLGYFGLKDWKKAEECLLEAYQSTPNDPEILRCLLASLLGQEKFHEAAAVGRSLMEMLGPAVGEDDVGRVALAFIGSGKQSKARELLDAFPRFDTRNPFLRQAEKELNRASRAPLASLFKGMSPIKRLLSANGSEGLRALTQKAKSLVGSASGNNGHARQSTASVAPSVSHRKHSTSASVSSPESSAPVSAPSQSEPLCMPLSLEFWIYASSTATPGWDDVRNNLVGQFAKQPASERALKLLSSLMESGNLRIEYLLQEDSSELFEYPEELLERNGKELAQEDRTTVLQAQMIVRVRLSVTNRGASDTFAVIVRLVEAIRQWTGGVVQDALSHTLWGVAQWRHWVENAEKNLIESQIRFEALDEGDAVWIHTHGMQKFGRPELEIDKIPPALVQSGLRLMLLTAKTFLTSRELRPDDVSIPFAIPGTPVLATMSISPADVEGHFPSGSLKLVPYLSGGSAEEPGPIEHVLEALNGKTNASAGAELQSAVRPGADSSQADAAAVREKLLEAHRTARVHLPVFKQSFRRVRDSKGHVHAVKVGFPAVGGNYEWMWVSLNTWQGESLEGHLQNSPILRKDLRKGARVHVTERQIFDWVIVRGGDIIKGAYTEALLA